MWSRVLYYRFCTRSSNLTRSKWLQPHFVVLWVQRKLTRLASIFSDSAILGTELFFWSLAKSRHWWNSTKFVPTVSQCSRLCNPRKGVNSALIWRSDSSQKARHRNFWLLTVFCHAIMSSGNSSFWHGRLPKTQCECIPASHWVQTRSISAIPTSGHLWQMDVSRSKPSLKHDYSCTVKSQDDSWRCAREKSKVEGCVDIQFMFFAVNRCGCHLHNISFMANSPDRSQKTAFWYSSSITGDQFC